MSRFKKDPSSLREESVKIQKLRIKLQEQLNRVEQRVTRPNEKLSTVELEPCVSEMPTSP